MAKKGKIPRELRNAAIAIDLLLTTILIAVYREDYSFTMFLATQPVAFFLALGWLEIVDRIR